MAICILIVQIQFFSVLFSSLVRKGTVNHPDGSFISKNCTYFKSCKLLPALMAILLGVQDQSLLKSKYIEISCTRVFFINCILIRCGCEPSDCQNEFKLSSRSCQTPLPVFAELRVHTASPPIQRRWWLFVGAVVDWVQLSMDCGHGYFVRSLWAECFGVCDLGFLQVIDLNLYDNIFDQLSKKTIKIQTKKTMLARGPNLLNLANYAKQQGQQIGYDPNEVAQMVEDEGINIQQQFDTYIKDIQKYDEILTKVAKSVNEVSAEEYFITDFYPQFAVNCTYENDQEKRIIAHHDIQLSRVIDNLERNNRNLKAEFKGWLFQYAKKTRLSQVLITENKLLRKYISAKNKDIVKLINGISNAENQELNQLNEDLNQLRQENGVLMDHLKEIKQALVQKADQEKKLVEAYQKAEREKLQIQTKIRQGEDEEQHYSKMVTLLESSLEDATQRQKKLLQQKQRLTKIKKQFEQDQAQIEKEIDACKMDRENIDKNLKTKFKGHQSQKQKLMDQIEVLTQKIKRVKQQSRNLEEEISRHEFKIEQYTTICADLDRKSAEMSEALKKSQEDHKKLKEVQIQQLSSIDMINFDIELIQQEIKQLDELEQENRDRYKKEIKNLENEKKQEFAKVNEEYSKAQWKANQAITQKKADIGLKKKQIQNLQGSIGKKKQQIEELKQQLAQVKENQATFSNLKQKLRDAQKK